MELTCARVRGVQEGLQRFHSAFASVADGERTFRLLAAMAVLAEASMGVPDLREEEEKVDQEDAKEKKSWLRRVLHRRSPNNNNNQQQGSSSSSTESGAFARTRSWFQQQWRRLSDEQSGASGTSATTASERLGQALAHALVLAVVRGEVELRALSDKLGREEAVEPADLEEWLCAAWKLMPSRRVGDQEVKSGAVRPPFDWGSIQQQVRAQEGKVKGGEERGGRVGRERTERSLGGG